MSALTATRGTLTPVSSRSPSQIPCGSTERLTTPSNRHNARLAARRHLADGCGIFRHKGSLQRFSLHALSSANATDTIAYVCNLYHRSFGHFTVLPPNAPDIPLATSKTDHPAQHWLTINPDSPSAHIGSPSTLTHHPLEPWSNGIDIEAPNGIGIKLSKYWSIDWRLDG